MVSAYLVDILILLAAAVVVVPLFQTARLGAVPGFLVAGVIVGPAGLALIDNVDEIVRLAEIGVVLLLFVIGIELRPSRLWLMRRLVFGLGSAQVLLSGLVLGAAGYYLLDLPLAAALLAGPALALSSTAVVLQLLGEQKAFNTPYGRNSFAILLMQDLAVVPLLALVPLLAKPDLGVGGGVGLALLESLLVLTLVLVGGRYLLHPVLHRVARAGSPEVFTTSAVLIVLGAALATEHAGLSMAMGAFLAGLLMSESAYRHQVIAEIQPFRGLLLDLFFMSMGMLLNLGLLLQNPLGALALLTALILVKVILLFPLARLSGLPWRPALAVSLLLAQGGEFALVLFGLARQAELLPAQRFQELLLVVLLSMLVTPLLGRYAHRLATRRSTSVKPVELEPGEADAAPIVIAGYGRVGRRIGEILTRAGRPFLALDSDPDIVARERAQGIPVFFGDLRQQGLLRAVGAGDAGLIVVTLNDPQATSQLVGTLRDQYPGVAILARGHNLETCRDLARMGAAGVVSENVEASLELSRMVLNRIGVDDDESEQILVSFRDRYHTQIHDSPPTG